MRLRVPFSEADLPRLQSFGCGALPFQKEVSDWIVAPATTADSALGDMRTRGTSVWLYETDDGDVIGFGSLANRVWTIPNRQSGKKEAIPIQLIPNFAIDSRFKRKPEGAPEKEWYSRIVFEDLLVAAYERAVLQGLPRWLGLLVFADNLRAIKMYEEFGFEQIGRTKANYNRMLADLSEETSSPAE